MFKKMLRIIQNVAPLYIANCTGNFFLILNNPQVKFQSLVQIICKLLDCKEATLFEQTNNFHKPEPIIKI